MPNKLKIWVVDDNYDHRIDITAALIPSEGILSNDKVPIIYDLFDVQEFGSAKKVEEQLLKLEKNPSALPHFIITDNNFEAADEALAADRATNRGLQLLEFIHHNAPQVPFALVTNYAVAPFLQQFFQLADASPLAIAAQMIFSSGKQEINSDDRLQRALQEIVLRILNQLLPESKDAINKCLGNDFEQLIQLQVKTYEGDYLMGSLLAAWSEIVYDQSTETAKLYYSRETILQKLRYLLPRPQQQFQGQLNSTHPAIVQLRNQAIPGDQLDEISKQVIETFERLLKHPSWEKITRHEKVTTETREAILNLAQLVQNSPLCIQPAHITLNPDLAKEELQQRWLNLLRCRLTVIAIYAIRKRLAIPQHRISPMCFSLDFAIHALLRGNPGHFWSVLEQMIPTEYLPARVDRIRNRRQNTRTHITVHLGLSAAFGQVLYPPDLEITPEKLIMQCWYPHEQQFFNEIIAGGLLAQAN
jgi:CheY-like chemotaxis protein